LAFWDDADVSEGLGAAMFTAADCCATVEIINLGLPPPRW
jgi:hypothetical protein